MATPRAAVDVSPHIQAHSLKSKPYSPPRINNTTSDTHFDLPDSPAKANMTFPQSPRASLSQPNYQLVHPPTPVPSNTPILPSTAVFPNQSFSITSDASNSSLDALLISDTSTAYSDEDDNDALTFLLNESPAILPRSVNSYNNLKPQCGDHSDVGLGLGIVDIDRKDGTAPFDGLGIVSIHGSPWYGHSRNVEYVDEEPITLTAQARRTGSPASPVSDIFLQEALKTFVEDPFHCHALTTILEDEEESVPPEPDSLARRIPSKSRLGLSILLNAIPEADEDEIGENNSAGSNEEPPQLRLVSSPHNIPTTFPRRVLVRPLRRSSFSETSSLEGGLQDR
ncbi:hypothetical protein AX16_003338 [Volvariella volvacea WC 439]|nr:hypothetical protein AX16_003338 [Volvariella volvacea WC 439]